MIIERVRELQQVQDAQFLWKAVKRNNTIPSLIASGKNMMVRDPAVTERTRNIVSKSVGTLGVIGVDNLEDAIELSAKEDVTVTPNHETDADHILLRLALAKAGQEDFANRLYFSAGLKMRERLYIRLFNGAENALLTPTPQDIEEINEQKARHGNGWRRSVIDSYEANCRRLTVNSFHKLAKLRKEKRAVSVVYVQAGRDREQGMTRRGCPDVAQYFRGKGNILPVMIYGMQPIFPANKLPRILERADVTVIFGPTYKSSLISNLDEAGLPEWKPGVPSSRIDVVMANIAALNWDYVDDSVRDSYRRLHEHFLMLPDAA